MPSSTRRRRRDSTGWAGSSSAARTGAGTRSRSTAPPPEGDVAAVPRNVAPSGDGNPPEADVADAAAVPRNVAPSGDDNPPEGGVPDAAAVQGNAAAASPGNAPALSGTSPAAAVPEEPPPFVLVTPGRSSAPPQPVVAPEPGFQFPVADGDGGDATGLHRAYCSSRTLGMISKKDTLSDAHTQWAGLHRRRPEPVAHLLSIRVVWLWGTISILMSTLLLTQTHLDVAVVPGTNFTEPIGVGSETGLISPGEEGNWPGAPIETVLIVATVPYDLDHLSSLWTILECVSDGIDRVLIAAPAVAWAREVITKALNEFKRLAGETNRSLPDMDVAYFTNDRYDAGLWCDGLIYIGFDGEGNATNSMTSHGAVFLINDSSVVLRPYRSLTDRIVRSAEVERRNETRRANVKLLSLNGRLMRPPPDRHPKYFWVESVYRGLTPDAVRTFYRHSCSEDAKRACMGITGVVQGRDKRKECIVHRFEMTLAQQYASLEVDALFPTWVPSEWDVTGWMATHGTFDRKEHWIHGKRWYQYLREEHDFPFRKCKKGRELPTRCMSLIGNDNSWLKNNLVFPSKETLVAFQEEMFAIHMAQSEI